MEYGSDDEDERDRPPLDARLGQLTIHSLSRKRSVPASLAAVLRATGEGAQSELELTQLRQQQEQKQQQMLQQQQEQEQQQQMQQQQPNQRKMGILSRPTTEFGSGRPDPFDSYFDQPPGGSGAGGSHSAPVPGAFGTGGYGAGGGGGLRGRDSTDMFGRQVCSIPPFAVFSKL